MNETTGDIAERFGVSKSAVRAWATQGAPHRRDSAGRLIFDADELRRWLANHRRGDGHGGRRPGAGRPRSNGQRRAAHDDPEPADGDGADRVGPPSKERARLDAARRRKVEIEVAQQRGELLARFEVRRQWTKVTTSIGRRLDSMGRNVSGEIVAQEGLPPERVQPIREIVERRCQEVMDDLARGQF